MRSKLNRIIGVLLMSALTMGTMHAAPLFNGNAGVPGSEASGMQVLYELAIPNASPNWRNGNPIPYSTDNSGAILLGSYSRIGYYMEITSGAQAGEFVYVSMDSFDPNPATLGLPHNVNNPVIHQSIVSNANIYSNNASIVNGTGIATVNLEMWSTNYNQSNGIGIPGASGATFDFGDGGAGIGAGHGSFQIHNYGATQTLFGFNDWGGNNPGTPSEFGIGPNLGPGTPDWTFANSGQAGFLQILVGTPIAAVPEPSSYALFGLLALAMIGGAKRRRQ